MKPHQYKASRALRWISAYSAIIYLSFDYNVKGSEFSGNLLKMIIGLMWFPILFVFLSPVERIVDVFKFGRLVPARLSWIVTLFIAGGLAGYGHFAMAASVLIYEVITAYAFDAAKDKA